MALPVTTPPELTDAMPVALLLQVPPTVPSVNGSVPPRQTTAGVGVIASGAAFTVIVTLEEQ